MKTCLTALALIVCVTSFAQEESTRFSNISVVTTSAGTAAQLTWIKGKENVSYFIVERSNDGIEFKQCGIVFLSDEPGFTEYKFRDRISNTTHSLLYRIGVVTEHKRVYYLPVKKLVTPQTL
jgi:hypothetical protein